MDVAEKSEAVVMPAAPLAPMPTLAHYPVRWADITDDLLATLGPMGRMAAGGLSLCPIASDGTKKAIGRWKEYQTRIANPIQVAGWCRLGLGYAIIAGVISGGLEILDFDDGELYPRWYEQCHDVMVRYDLPIVATPSRGYHIYWRCSEISGSVKLAKSETGDTLIETRGQGGYAAGPFNPRTVHKTGRLYLQMGGVELPAVPTITPEERRLLLRSAIAFDKFGTRKIAIQEAATALRQKQWKQTHGHQDKGFRVGDAFKAKAKWPEVLEPHGWTHAGGTFWTRPDGDRGAHSASVGASSDGTSLLRVWSSNAGALAPTSGSLARWDLFSAYAALNHGGDRKAAAIELLKQEYGE